MEDLRALRVDDALCCAAVSRVSRAARRVSRAFGLPVVPLVKHRPHAESSATAAHANARGTGASAANSSS